MPTSASWILSLPSAPTSGDADNEYAQNNNPLGYGLALPFTRQSTDFYTAEGAELVKSCIRQVLGTRAGVGAYRGELPWRPNFGSQLHLLRHQLQSLASPAAARVYVIEALRAWEPRITVTGVHAETVQRDGGTALIVKVRYALRSDDEEIGSVVLPNEVAVEV
jgi:phage baseplate assembly protein W